MIIRKRKQVMILLLAVVVLLGGGVVLTLGSGGRDADDVTILGDDSMTLDDVRKLAAMGEELNFENLQPYGGVNVSSTLNQYVMVYSVDGGYRLIVHSTDGIGVQQANLERIEDNRGIDIRYDDVEGFVNANGYDLAGSI